MTAAGAGGAAAEAGDAPVAGTARESDLTLESDKALADGAGPVEQGAGSPVRRWTIRVGVAVVVGALLVGIVVAGLVLRDASTRATERDALVGTARQAAVAFTSYDQANLDASFDAVLDLATEDFREQFRLASDRLRPVIAEKKASARGEVLAAAVERYGKDHDSASVLVAVDSTVTNTDVPAGAVQRFRLRLTLERAGEQWRVAEITPVV